MKRRRLHAPGGQRPDGRRRPLVWLTLLIALAGCGQPSLTEPPAGSSTPAPSEPASPSQPRSTEPSAEPSAGAPSASTEAPTSSPNPPSTTSPSAPSPGGASACSGSDENRDFFASMAAAVDWTVYCPVLGDGWFVDDGRYRLAGGGWLEIGYDGPGDARLILRQGAFCQTGDGCVPAGRNVGSAAFGDRTGSMIAGDDGTWSVIVDQGAHPSWLLVTDGLGEDATRQLAAALHPIEG